MNEHLSRVQVSRVLPAMFEQLLVDLLNRVLGDFVSNLETNQLNLGIWKGIRHQSCRNANIHHN